MNPTLYLQYHIVLLSLQRSCTHLVLYTSILGDKNERSDTPVVASNLGNCMRYVTSTFHVRYCIVHCEGLHLSIPYSILYLEAIGLITACSIVTSFSLVPQDKEYVRICSHINEKLIKEEKH